MNNLTKITLFLLLISSCSFNRFSYTKTSSGIEISLNGKKKRIEFYDDNLVRVSVTGTKNAFKDSSLAVIAGTKKVDFQIEDQPGELVLKTSRLILQINKNNGSVIFLDPSNRVYLSEHPDALPELKDTLVSGGHYYAIRQTFQIGKEEGIYGLGQFQNGFMNYRNKDLLLVQANKISIVPMLVSTNNYGVLWDNYSHSEFHDGAGGMSFSSEVADQIDYYFIGNRNMDGVVSGYRELTGRAPMFSEKAYGYWQSKERYKSFDELNEVVAKYRKNHIPIDNIVQDWRYWGEGKYWSSMYFEPENYPDPAENIKKLHDQHVGLMVSIWPSLGKSSQIFKDMQSNGFLLNQDHWCGGKVYDAYNPEARKLYWKHVQKGLFENGVDAYWMDGTEPEFSNTDDQETTEKEILKVGKTFAGPAGKYLNTYALETTEGVYQGQRAFTDQKRVFILSRSSWAGQQRNATVTWSGDVSANYENLKKQISGGINFCMAGVPYWTHDIGAFFPSGKGGLYPQGIDDPAYGELYVRWFQFGAFCPIFRSHGTGTPREVWQFKDRNPEYYRALLKVLKLRYRLLPYIYSEAWQVTANNYTLMRGLAMDFPQDKKVYDIAGQYMFGPSFLVKPVTKNMYYDIPVVPDAIPEKYLLTSENTPGLKATYFADKELKKAVYTGVDKEINFNWGGGGLPQGVPENNFSVRWEGMLAPTESGSYKIAFTADDGLRLWLNNKLVIDEWKNQNSTFYYTINLEAGKKYPVKIEYYQGKGGAMARLGWFTPSDQKNNAELTKTDSVYLPAGNDWYDFWTSKLYPGGQTISKDFPIDIFPLFVKAGSIVPFGPEIQYAGQKSDDPVEIRVYPGHNAGFTWYEDEGDNYNYEKGAYNTIAFSWDDAARTLQIGKSTGQFDGYEKNRIFDVVLVDEQNLKHRKITYNGEPVGVKF